MLELIVRRPEVGTREVLDKGPLAGDQLFVDLDLSGTNLPPAPGSPWGRRNPVLPGIGNRPPGPTLAHTRFQKPKTVL